MIKYIQVITITVTNTALQFIGYARCKWFFSWSHIIGRLSLGAVSGKAEHGYEESTKGLPNAHWPATKDIGIDKHIDI